MSAGEAFFVDTNVLLYSVGDADLNKNRRARAWLGSLWLVGSGRLSHQVLHEFYVNAVKKSGMQVSEVRRAVRYFASWHPVEISLTVIARGWHWIDNAQVSYWDSLIVSSAELSGCRWLLTEDLQDGRTFDTVTVINPFRASPSEFGLTPPS